RGGGVAKERTVTIGRVVVAGGVEIERLGANCRVVDAGCVLKKRFQTGGRVVVTVVLIEREGTGGRVAAAGGVVEEHSATNGRVVLAGCVVIERFKTVGCVLEAASEAEKRISTLSRVGVGIASIGRGTDRLCFGQKSKAGKRKQNRCESSVSIFHDFNFPFISWSCLISVRSLMYCVKFCDRLRENFG